MGDGKGFLLDTKLRRRFTGDGVDFFAGDGESSESGELSIVITGVPGVSFRLEATESASRFNKATRLTFDARGRYLTKLSELSSVE